MADGSAAVQALHHPGFGHGVTDQSNPPLGIEAPAVEGNDARRLLAPVL